MSHVPYPMPSAPPPHRIDISNIGSPAPTYLRAIAPGQFDPVDQSAEVNEWLRRALRAEDVPVVPQSEGRFSSEPRRPFSERCPRTADTLTWIAVAARVLYRELYGPAHLRRYL